jgi:excinuclease UvrABC nuclease subunit
VKYTKSEIENHVKEFEREMLHAQKIQFTFDRKWSSNFPAQAGIYMIFDKEKLVYIGETANLKDRMKEVKRTYNHSFRRKLGKFLINGAIITKGKFKEELENTLNQYYLDNIQFAYKELNWGRLEMESHLIHRHSNDGILNSIGKRNKIES